MPPFSPARISNREWNPNAAEFRRLEPFASPAPVDVTIAARRWCFFFRRIECGSDRGTWTAKFQHLVPAVSTHAGKYRILGAVHGVHGARKPSPRNRWLTWRTGHCPAQVQGSPAGERSNWQQGSVGQIELVHRCRGEEETRQ